MTDEGVRNHLINQYLSRIADLWIPTDTTAEKVSFVNFLATAINSWRPIRPEYFHEPTAKALRPPANGTARLLGFAKSIERTKKASRRRSDAEAQ